jgi:ribonuclease T2
VVPLDLALRLAAPLAALATVAFLQTAAADEAGDFDFYLLSLSWSPTYCIQEGDADEPQCALPGGGFVVHGLWPQYEAGYPQYCETDQSDWVDRDTIRNISDIMPGGGGFVGYQWRKHGLCSGLAEEDYFALMRRAYERVTIPEVFSGPEDDTRLSPAGIEAAFAAANDGLSTADMSVQCRSGALSEIRICLTKDLEFRRCDEVDGDSCRTRSIAVPAPD